MQNELTESVKSFLKEIDGSIVQDHSFRIECARKAIDALNAFVENEVRVANSLPRNAPGYLSWDAIAKALGVSKTAAYVKYGGKNERANCKTK